MATRSGGAINNSTGMILSHAAAGVDRSRLRGCVLVTATVMEENLEDAALKAVMDAIPSISW